ncbi:P-loop containing nucleoside triphosphate hydrolase protein [Pholiota molesta]|nr:P-loop containing nucleoside triphosphate hydrolase protein [Pholiota molesta]
MSSSEPLSGFVPGHVKGDQVRKAMDGDVNPFTTQPHSQQYKEILIGRKTLPVFAQMDEFLQIFNDNQIIVMVGEPGSGKSTQIPQFVAFSDLPHMKEKMVVCTQPRRVAAMSIAMRVADEMDVQLGRHVGYSTRFEDMAEPGTTFLKYTTDDVLLQEAVNDPFLERYSTIILDEAHDRALATDILISLLKPIVHKRKDLKVIIISATLEEALKFQKHFSIRSNMQAPLFRISSRSHPVEVLYTQEPEPDYIEAAIRTTMMIHRSEEPGDILLFLTAEEEIEEVCRKLRLEAYDCFINKDPSSVGPLVCIPLYPSLSPQQVQQRIFDPSPADITGGSPRRKVVISTDIAQTLLPIDGIVYNPRVRVVSRLVSPISKASAQQRTACAGRTRPGKCFRLYPEKDFMSQLEERTHPELLRSNLSSTVLQMLKVGIKDLVTCDYVDAPAIETLMRALELLNYLAALDDDGNLTPLGGMMSEFPLDPQLTKLLIISPKFGCSHEILTIAAMMSVPDIWLRPYSATTWLREEADAAKARLTIPDSDHLTLLNVYNQYDCNRHDKNWALNNYLSLRVLQQADSMRDKLKCIMERRGIEFVTASAKRNMVDSILQALVCGFFMQVAHKEDEHGHYLTVKDNQLVTLHPSCGLVRDPEWVLFNEFILTTRPYLRTVSEVKAEWLTAYAGNYFDLSTFPAGQAKRALQRAGNKRSSRAGGAGTFKRR